MVKRKYAWTNGAILQEHSKRKHQILRQYVFDYLTVRCQLPQQEKFRLAIIDGFAGGGRYTCGTPGSPIIFLEELKHATEWVNSRRLVQGLPSIEVECLLVFNDVDPDAIGMLEKYVAPLLVETAQICPKLHLRVEYLSEPFEQAFIKIKALLEMGRYRSVLVNLDQCGDSHVNRRTIAEIIQSYPSAEVFYTIMISSLLAFLHKSEPDQLTSRLSHLGVTGANIGALTGMMSNNDWLGAAEKIVFDAFRLCACYVSPFSINNPGGWRYWLVHFSNAYRARQVYNNILHANASIQAHFGRSGLNMLSYDPRYGEGTLYLFDEHGRASARDQLFEDIPRLVSESGDAMSVLDFYAGIYNITPAHAADINEAIIGNPDLEVITVTGGERRKANTINVTDVIKLKRQRSFFPSFLSAGQSGSSGQG